MNDENEKLKTQAYHLHDVFEAARNERDEARLALESALRDAQEHEEHTHKVLGSILGVDDSLEECAKRLVIRVQRAEASTTSLVDENERLNKQIKEMRQTAMSKALEDHFDCPYCHQPKSIHSPTELELCLERLTEPAL